MALIKAKQIEKLVAGYIAGDGFLVEVPDASNINRIVLSAADITRITSTASNIGGPVPEQTSRDALDVLREGFITETGKNLVEVYLAVGKSKIDDGKGNEVYGRLTYSSAEWAVTFYSLKDNVETVFPFLPTTKGGFDAGVTTEFDLELVLPYVFDFNDLPSTFMIAISSSYANDDVRKNYGASLLRKTIVATAKNTLPKLTKKYVLGEKFEMTVNGQEMIMAAGDFSVDMTTFDLTWYPEVAGFDIDTDDEIKIAYITDGVTV